MSLPTVSYNKLHEIRMQRTQEQDEEMISRVVNQVYNMVLDGTKRGLLSIKWSVLDNMFDDVALYEYKHIVIATTRLKVIFPGTEIYHNKKKEITVEWY